MSDKPRYTIKKYTIIIVLSSTVGMLITTGALLLLGFGCQGTLVVVIFVLPFWAFGILYGFYKGLVKSYGLKGEEKLFFGGRF